MKKLFSLFAVVMVAVMSLNISSLSVKAADPTTYVVKYNSEKENWFYQTGSTWDEDQTGREMYYMTLDMKDGDYLVVAPSEGFPTLDIDFNLGNLTVMPDGACIVNAKSIKDCYICEDAYVVVNGNVENAYIYKEATANFNNDVNYLEHYYTDEIDITVGVGGKLNHLYIHTDGYSKYDLYDFTAPFIMEDGVLKTELYYYTNTPSSSTNTTTAPAVTPSASTNADEYDDVPKTGQSNAYLWAFGLAAVCFLGSYSLKKRA